MLYIVGGRHAVNLLEDAVEGGDAGDAARLGDGLHLPVGMLAHLQHCVLDALAVEVGREVVGVAISLDNLSDTVLVDAKQLTNAVTVEVGI